MAVFGRIKASKIPIHFHKYLIWAEYTQLSLNKLRSSLYCQHQIRIIPYIINTQVITDRSESIFQIYLLIFSIHLVTLALVFVYLLQILHQLMNLMKMMRMILQYFYLILDFLWNFVLSYYLKLLLFLRFQYVGEWIHQCHLNILHFLQAMQLL